MPLTCDGLDLVGAQESQSATDAQADVTSAPSQATDEALIVSLKARESLPLSGTATGIRLSSLSGYPSDPADALSQWVQEFETLVQPQQGDGWTLADDERNRSVNVVVTDLSWTHNAGGPYEVQWELTAERGEGVLDDAPRTPTSVTPNSTVTLTPSGGSAIDLGSVDEKRTELATDVDITPIAYGDPSDSVISPNSGTTRRVTLSGRVGGTPSELRTFETDVRSISGTNTQVSYQTDFPGHTLDVVVSGFDPTYVAGQPSTLRYSMTVLEGVTV